MALASGRRVVLTAHLNRLGVRESNRLVTRWALPKQESLICLRAERFSPKPFHNNRAPSVRTGLLNTSDELPATPFDAAPSFDESATARSTPVRIGLTTEPLELK
jgi:hypothetical protein